MSLSHRKYNAIVNRRTVLAAFGATGLALAVAACSQASTPPPQPSPPPAKPTVPPTAASAPPTMAPAATKPAPVATPAAAAPTSAPAKRTFQPATIKLGYSTSERVDIARRLADKLGYFNDFRITVEVSIIRGTSDIIRAMLNDELSMGSIDALTTLSSMEQGSPIKYLAPNESKLPNILYARPDIKTMKDLEGQSVATNAAGSLNYNTTRLLLREGGVELDKVEFVTAPNSSAIFQAIVVGKVAAGQAAEANQIVAKKEGLVILAKSWDMLPNFISGFFATTDANLTSRRDEIVRFIAAYAKLFRYLRDPASKQAWVDVAVNEVQQDREEAEITWQGIFDNHVLDPSMALSKDKLDYLQNVNIEVGGQKAIMPLEQIADLSIARDALALLQ